jgi:chromate transport protein ChrA
MRAASAVDFIRAVHRRAWRGKPYSRSYVIVVLVALIAIARAALRSRSTVLVAIGAAILMLTGVHEIEVLLLAGVVKALASYRPENSRGARPWWIC